VFRLLLPLLSLFVLSCAGATFRPHVTDFAPLSPAASEEASRQIRIMSEAVPLETYEAHVFQARNGLALPYRFLRPGHGHENHPRRLVVIFHGSGAIGTDNRSQVGPLARSWATAGVRKRFGAVVLIPQFPARSANYRLGSDSLPYSEGTELLSAAIDLVQHIRTTENVASEDTFAIGFSMGGSAVWNVLRDHPRLFARAVIIAGVPTAGAPSTLGSTRVLLVHGDADTENPYTAAWNVFVHSKGAIDFWRFRGLGHEFPHKLITTDRIREWLFVSRR
jgi:predicted peptidase